VGGGGGGGGKKNPKKKDASGGLALVDGQDVILAFVGGKKGERVGAFMSKKKKGYCDASFPACAPENSTIQSTSCNGKDAPRMISLCFQAPWGGEEGSQ